MDDTQRTATVMTFAAPSPNGFTHQAHSTFWVSLGRSEEEAMEKLAKQMGMKVSDYAHVFQIRSAA